MNTKSFRDMKCLLWVLLIIVGVTACSKEVPLDKKQFTSLLIDMHMTDGMLTAARGIVPAEKDSYLYYNDLFKKYGITRADFDSCVIYYSKQTVLFNKMYDVVIDTLNRRQTKVMREWKELTMNDTVDLFPGYTMIVADTLRADSTQVNAPKKDSVVYVTRVVKEDTVYLDKRNPFVLVELDSIVPGFYKFMTTVKFDQVDKNKRNSIQSYLISENNDTLKMPERSVGMDTIRAYKKDWDYYVADSTYKKLVVKIVESTKLPKVKVKKKVDQEGRVWGTKIHKVYVAPHHEERLKAQYAPIQKQKTDPKPGQRK